MARRHLGVPGALLVGIAALAGPMHAQVALTFEGLRNGEAVQDFYGGGAGALGSTGALNASVAFSSNALALVRSNAGGTGNFGGEPSGETVVFFLTGRAATMNHREGFTTGFSFYYSAAFQPGFIRVFDGLDGTGTLLAQLALPTTGNGALLGCPRNPGANFCAFVPIGVSFTGVARSIDFGGTVNQIAFDNITFGSDVPLSTVPEPGALLLVGSGLTVLAAWHRRGRRRA